MPCNIFFQSLPYSLSRSTVSKQYGWNSHSLTNSTKLTQLNSNTLTYFTQLVAVCAATLTKNHCSIVATHTSWATKRRELCNSIKPAQFKVNTIQTYQCTKTKKLIDKQTNLQKSITLVTVSDDLCYCTKKCATHKCNRDSYKKLPKSERTHIPTHPNTTLLSEIDSSSFYFPTHCCSHYFIGVL